MNNFINFFNTFFSYILLVAISVVVMIIAFKLGVYWSRKSDEKKAREELEEKANEETSLSEE